jgi:hypothetical protein
LRYTNPILQPHCALFIQAVILCFSFFH